MFLSVYLKCIPGVNITDPLTFDTELYEGISVPFVRPCKSMCDALTTSCKGIPEFYGNAVNCSKTFDYSGGNNITNSISNTSMSYETINEGPDGNECPTTRFKDDISSAGSFMRTPRGSACV